MWEIALVIEFSLRNVKQLALNYIDLPTFDNNYRYGC